MQWLPIHQVLEIMLGLIGWSDYPRLSHVTAILAPSCCGSTTSSSRDNGSEEFGTRCVAAQAGQAMVEWRAF
eukprot:11859563-Alexandrium_andersonii.AAC.1